MTVPKRPVRIVYQSGSLKATTSVEAVYDTQRNISRELWFIENDYSALINILRGLYSSVKSNTKADPRIFWLIGDYVLSFFQRISSLGFYLLKQNETIARDISISESSMKKIVSFRRRYNLISSVDTSVSWSKYRENKAHTVNVFQANPKQPVSAASPNTSNNNTEAI